MIHSRALIQVSCKILGLLLLVSSASMIAFIPQGILMATRESSGLASTIYGYFAMPIVNFIFAFILLKYSESIAQKLDSANQDISISSNENWPKTLYDIGIRLIGVYVVVKGVPDIIGQISHTLMRHQTASQIPIYGWAPVFATALYLALGLHLLAGGSLIAKLTERLNRQ